MQNFEQKFKQEKTANPVESNNTIKTEILDTKKPESHEDLTNRLKANLEQSKSLKEKIQGDTEHLNKIRQALGLGHQTEDTVSMKANKEKLASLSKEYSEIHGTILEDDTYSIDNLEGVFEDQTHMGHKIATKGNLMWEKSSRDMQNSWEKQKASRDNITPSKLEEEGNIRTAAEKIPEDRKSFEEMRKDDDKKTKETNEYFSNNEYVKQKTQEDLDINDMIGSINDPDGSKKEHERQQKDAWDNYENTVRDMNEHVGYNPVSWEKYEAQFKKEGVEKGWSEKDIEDGLQKMKDNPHATWI